MGQAPWWALLGFATLWAVSAWLAFELFRASFDVRVAKESVATLLFGIPITTIAWNDIVKVVRHTGLSDEGVYESIIVLYGIRRKIRIGEGLLGDFVRIINNYSRNNNIPIYEKGRVISAQEIGGFLAGQGIRILPIDHWTIEVDRLALGGPRPPGYSLAKVVFWLVAALGVFLLIALLYRAARDL